MRSHRLFSIAGKSFLIFVILVFILVGSILTRLYIEPVDLDFLKPRLTDFLKQETNGMTVTLESPKLRWKGPGHSLEILSHSLKIRTPDALGFSADIPTFYLTLRFRSLLTGHIMPSILTLENPHLVYAPRKAFLQGQSRTDVSDKTLKNVFNNIFTPSNQTKILKRLRFLNATFSLNLGPDFGAWSSPETTFILNRKQGFIDGFLDLKLGIAEQITGSFSYLANQAVWKLDLDFHKVLLPTILQKLKGFENFSTLLVQELATSKLPLNGSIALTLSRAFKPQKADIKLISEKGHLILGNLLPKPLPYEKMIFEAFYKASHNSTTKPSVSLLNAFTEGDWTSHLSFSSRGTDVNGYLNLKQDNTSKRYLFSAQADLKNFPLKSIPLTWPKGLANPAREWLVEHLISGHIPKATVQIEASLGSVLNDFSLKQLEGKIVLKQGILRYLKTMPDITNISAVAHFDAAGFDIDVQNGTSEKLEIQQGKVLIKGLNQNNQDISIQTTTLGPLKGALKILNSKPLEILKDSNFDPSQCQGTSHANLYLSFPLDDRFTEKSILFSANAHLTKIYIPKPLSFLEIDLSDGDIRFSVDNKALKATGNARFNDLLTDLSWQRSLEPGKISETVHLKSPLTNAFIKSLNVTLPVDMRGTIPTEVNYSRKSSMDSVLKISMNLTPTRLILGGWQKNEKSQGTLKSIWHFRNNILSHLEHFHFDTDDLKIKASAVFKKDLSLKKATLTSFKFGETSLKGRLVRAKDVTYKITLEGPHIDLSPYLEAFKKTNISGAQLDKTFDLRLITPRISLLQKHTFYKNSMSLRFFQNRVHSVSFKGYLDQQATKEFYIDVLPRANNGRRLRLKCQDAGYMLKALNFFDDVIEGRLKLTANQADDDPKSPWEGKLEISKFWLHKAPILSRLLSMAFPTGLVEAFSKKGLPFERLKIKFKKSGPHITLNRGRSYSPGFGFSVNGSILDDFSNLNIHGTVYPAYFFNTFLSKIPLLGQIITGGKHEGIWGVSYSITGPSSSPEIQVNPLTVFAPGIFRKLFLPADESGFDENEEDENEDEEGQFHQSFIE